MVSQSTPLTLSGPAAHDVQVAGQVTIRFVSCSSDCSPVTVDGYVGFNATLTALGPFSGTLDQAGDEETISMSGVETVNPGSTDGTLTVRGSWPSDDSLEVVASSVDLIDLGVASPVSTTTMTTIG